MQNIFCRNSFSKVNFATLTTLSIVLLLVLLGIVVLLTASQPIDSSLPQKQLLWILISIIFGLIFFKLDLEKIRPLIPYFGLFSLILLFLRDSFTISETFSLFSGCRIAILSIKFLNSLTFPCQLWLRI